MEITDQEISVKSNMSFFFCYFSIIWNEKWFRNESVKWHDWQMQNIVSKRLNGRTDWFKGWR